MNGPHYELVIIVPCYKEAGRLETQRYSEFLDQHPDTALVLVNDGSPDKTLAVLEKIQQASPQQVRVIQRTENQGKAYSVREGMLYAREQFPAYKYAFIDADLAVSLEECHSLSQNLNEQKPFVFGSRKKTKENHIIRKAYRHFIGRIVATAISVLLKLGIYDTQCGCKIVSRDLVPVLFTAPFLSKWLFDVELFFRMLVTFGSTQTQNLIQEIPVQQWIDTQDSRVSLSYAFRLWFDLFQIGQYYRRLNNEKGNSVQ